MLVMSYLIILFEFLLRHELNVQNTYATNTSINFTAKAICTKNSSIIYSVAGDETNVYSFMLNTESRVHYSNTYGQS